MKILILDGFTLFQKDLNISVFEKYGEIIYRDRTSKDELKRRIRKTSLEETERKSRGLCRSVPRKLFEKNQI